MTISLLFSVVVYHTATGEINGNAERQYLGLRRLYRLPPSYVPQSVMNEEEEAARRLLVRLIEINAVILAASALAGYYWARQTLEPIENAMEMQGRFAADASHELRTPLAAMRSEIEVTLRQKQINEREARELFGSNLEEIDKLEGLANGLLQLARLEAGITQKAFGSVDLSQVTATAVMALKPVAKQKQMTLKQVGVAKPLAVLGDSDGLTQVVKILLDNAIKYSPAQSTATIKIERRGHRGVISIRDTGPGISPADQAHIFERFWRAGSARNKDSAGGYGLGLAIARQIVTLHNGDIGVASKLGRGTTFTVELPLA